MIHLRILDEKMVLDYLEGPQCCHRIFMTERQRGIRHPQTAEGEVRTEAEGDVEMEHYWL